MHTSDGSSVTSDSYTETSYSTVDPPSQLNIQVNHSGVSGISDPSAATAVVVSRPVFAPVLEETNSAVDADASGVSPKNNAGDNHPPSPAQPVLPLECDYDQCPSELYQAIEAKRWDVVFSLFRKEPAQAKEQAATWVVRKEPTGRLRWRLLPVHAAVIFQAPINLVEKLLQECPQAAQAKDDQGMLPLHLAFRTKTTCWETVEELVTLHPQAVLVKDRKGRTPLECGLASATAAAQAESASKSEIQAAPSGGSTTSSFIGGLMSPKKPPVTPRAHGTFSKVSGGMTAAQHKAMFSVLELYTQASCQEQIQNAMTNSRKALETRIGAVQDSHVQTLTQLKKGWETQRNDLNRKMQGYRKELQTVKSDFNIQQEILQEKVNTEMELVDRLHQVTTALENKTVMSDEDAEVVARDISKMQSHELKEANKKAEVLKATNKELLLLLETLLDDQNALKTSLDKLSWDTKTKNDERKDLLNKYFDVHEQSVEMAESYTQEWQQRLNQTSVDVSAKLSKILSQNQLSSTQAGNSNPAGPDDEYNGEEKKDAYDGITSVHSSSLGSGAMTVSVRQDP